MIDRRLVQNFDWSLLGLTILLSFIGIMTLYSAVNAGKSVQDVLFFKQIIWYIIGFVLMIFSFLFNYKFLDRWAFIIYGVCILLLVLVLFFGKSAGGSRRWLILGPVTFQPSEFAKLAVIFVIARYYSKIVSTSGLLLSELIVPAILCIIPFSLIVLQPDLGTAMLIILIAASMSVFVKIDKKAFIFILTTVVVTIPTVWFFFLRDYQKKRIITFLNPDHDPLGAGYHIIQSKIAIGSGMITGKGFLKGTQSALSFLPEQQTDFIFSVFAEEWGFIGCLFLLLVFFMFITRCLKIIYGSRNHFGAILSFGITAMLLWHIVVNMGMALGLLPVVGVTLPFISYGGSSVVITLISIGILLNISMRRFLFN